MNKLLIVLLAVCLVSTHAFVKREAPPASDLQTKVSDLQAKAAEVGQQLGEFGKSIGDQASKIFNPDVFKKKFSEIIDSAKEAMGKYTAPSETKPASEAKPAA